MNTRLTLSLLIAAMGLSGYILVRDIASEPSILLSQEVPPKRPEPHGEVLRRRALGFESSTAKGAPVIGQERERGIQTFSALHSPSDIGAAPALHKHLAPRDAAAQRLLQPDASSEQTHVPAMDAPPARMRRLVIEPRLMALSSGGLASRSDVIDREISLEVNSAVRQPVALAELDEDLTPSQANATISIADRFVDRVEEAVNSLPAEELDQTWDREQEDADSLYRILLGDAAYNVKLMEAALEALGLPAK